MNWKCIVCDTDVPDYEPEYCCRYISINSPCGCMGLPIEPPLCSLECAEKVFGKAVEDSPVMDKEAKAK